MAKSALTRDQWMQRIEAAATESRRKAWQDRSKRFAQYYEGKPALPSSSFQVIVNTVFKDIKSSLPRIFAKNPDVMARPKQPTPDSKALATIANHLLPYYYKELNLKRMVNRCLLDTKLDGPGYAKFGWSLELADEEVAPDAFEKMASADQARVMERTLAMKKREGEFIQQVIQQDEPWLLRWNPIDLLIDPEATSPDLSDARWIDCRKIMNRIEAQQQFPKKISDDTSFKVSKHAPEGQPWAQQLTLHEVFDKVRRERRLFIEEIQDFDETSPWDFDVDGFPVESIFFNEVPNCPYADPDVKYYESQLIEKNDIRTQQAEHRRAFNAQVLFEKKVLSPSELAKATKNIANAWIETAPGGTSKIIGRPTPALPPDLYRVEERNDVDLSDIIGSENQRGVGGPIEKTATEAAIIEARSRNRDNERQDAVEDFLHRLTVKLWVILRQKLPRVRVEEILGRPAPEWVNVDGRTARKELDIEIKTNSTLPKFDRAIMVQQNIQLMNILTTYAQKLAEQGVQVDLVPLLDETLDLMDQKVGADQILKRLMPPMGVSGPGGRPGGGAMSTPTPGSPESITLSGLLSELGGRNGGWAG